MYIVDCLFSDRSYVKNVSDAYNLSYAVNCKHDLITDFYNNLALAKKEFKFVSFACFSKKNRVSSFLVNLKPMIFLANILNWTLLNEGNNMILFWRGGKMKVFILLCI
ncbi:hypothetical protein MAR_014854 [Mya arenaria]|uniref:Uncharacterized protein n=1 Tax=Mya arenaria TaxID=6604 RepID=A0ABY7FFP0_MYAAR|nr:hypothetical protein MAR_014854 [Mya arenaria]